MLTQYGPLLIYVLSFPVMLLNLLRFEPGFLFFISIVPIIPLINKINKEYPFNVVDLLLVSMIFGWLFWGKKKGKTILKSSPLNLAILLVVVGSIIGLIRGYTFMGFSEDIDLIRLKAWKNYMILPVIYFIAVNNINTEKALKRILVCLCFTLLVMDFNFYSTFRWLRSLHYSDSIRISGPLGYLGPNELGAFYAIYTFLFLGISYYVENRKIKYLILLVCACNFYPILFSYSRAAYSATMVGFLTIGLLKDRKFLGLVIILVVLYSFILPTSVVERINMAFLDEAEMSQEKKQTSAIEVVGVELDTVGRKELWEKAKRYFEQETILGIGFDTFRHREGMITHCLYLKILAEQGLVGVSIFLIFTLLVLQQSYKLFKHSRSEIGKGIGLGFFVCEMVHLTGSISGDQSLYYNLMAIYWVFLGIVASFNVHYASGSKPALGNGGFSKC